MIFYAVPRWIVLSLLHWKPVNQDAKVVVTVGTEGWHNDDTSSSATSDGKDGIITTSGLRCLWWKIPRWHHRKGKWFLEDKAMCHNKLRLSNRPLRLALPCWQILFLRERIQGFISPMLSLRDTVKSDWCCYPIPYDQIAQIFTHDVW